MFGEQQTPATATQPADLSKGKCSNAREQFVLEEYKQNADLAPNFTIEGA